MTPSQRDRVVRIVIEPAMIHPLGLAASLPKQNQGSVNKSRGRWDGCSGGSEHLLWTAG